MEVTNDMYVGDLFYNFNDSILNYESSAHSSPFNSIALPLFTSEKDYSPLSEQKQIDNPTPLSPRQCYFSDVLYF